MPYIIDGHNLIGQLPTIQLADPDDEAKLVQLLQRYAMRHRISITVFFDRGSYGQSRLGGAGVSVIFARSPEDADRRIVRQIRRLTQPQQWTLVSADAALTRTAEERGLRVVHAAQFARRLLDLDAAPPPDTARAEAHAHVGRDELDEWLDLFGIAPDEASRPIDLQRRSTSRPEPRRPGDQAAGKRRQGQPGARPADRRGRPLLKPPPPSDPAEIDEWLRLFGEEESDAG